MGGEIGYRVKDAVGKESVEYKEYGTRADVVAIPTAGDQIHVDARIRVSELDPAHSVQAGENAVPAITCRETESELTLRSGETVAIVGGLVEEHTCWSNKTGDDGKSKVVHQVNKVETFVLVSANLVTKQTPGATSDKAGRTAKSSDGASRR